MLRRRFRTIVLFFARVVIGMAFWEILLPRLGLRKFSQKGQSRRYVNAARRYRLLAIKMGGVLIKVGQFLSVRVDMLPAAITDELSGLQDQVPAEDFQKIRQLAESELGDSLELSFTSFEEIPLASASLGQVHRAELVDQDVLNSNGTDIKHVVVKIQRPDIEKIIAVDLSAFRIVSGWLQRYKPIRKRVDLPALMEEFSSILSQEIDYINEGENAESFWEIYQDVSGIKIPRVIWSKTTKKVLTLEDVYAIKITNYQDIKESGVDLDKVARRLFSSYMEQIFIKEIFHADPHPGNLFVIAPDDSPDGNWQLAFVDFGMVGRVPASAREGLREGVIAFGTQDASRLVNAYEKLGFLLPNADLDLIEQAETRVFERVWGKSMKELSQMGHADFMDIGLEFRDLMYDMPFQIPQNLLLLGRTIAILSGMCTGLDPGFNVWESLRPYAEDLVKSEVTGNLDMWWSEIEVILKSLISLPRKIDHILSQLERGEFRVQVPEIKAQLAGLEKNLQNFTRSLFFLVFFMGGIQIYLAGFTLPGIILFVISLIPLVLILFR